MILGYNVTKTLTKNSEWQFSSFWAIGEKPGVFWTPYKQYQFSVENCMIEYKFLHSVIFIDWIYCDRWGPENRGCLSVCVSVCLCVCKQDYSQTNQPIAVKL